MCDVLLVAYLVLEYVSVILLLYLIVYCHNRQVNRTLQLFCAVALLNNVNETMLILHQLTLGMTSVDATRGEPICIANAVIEHLLPLVLAFLASCIGFHIWFVVVAKQSTTEQQMVKWYCLVSIGIPVVITILACVLLRDRPYFTSYPHRFYCTLADTPVTAATFALPLFVASVPGIIFS
ncbi:hypothetical protein DFQ26_001571, partial [Actinomortierella ambigua]